MPLFRQPSFAAGEIAPSLHGRTDLALYGQALATCKNFIVLPTGAVTNRPGLEFVTEVKDSTKKVRLIPFVFSDGQAYVLEFGDGYFRVIARVDGTSGYVTSGGNPVEVAGGWTEDALARFKFAQSGDILTLVNTGPTGVTGPIREIKRTAHDAWSQSGVDFQPTIGAPTNLALDAEPNTADATHPAKKWVWYVSTVSDTDESFTASVTSDRIVYPDQKRQRLTWTAVTGAKAYYVYRGPADSKLAGLVGVANAVGSPAFEDDGQAPDYSRQPRPSAGANPFNTDPYTDDYPSAVAYFQQRLVFGRTPDRPQTLFMSRIGELKRFDMASSQQDDDAIQVGIASVRMDEIRNIVPLRSLLVFTAGAEWSVGGPGNGAISPSNIEAVPHSYHGSSWASPVVVGNAVLFVVATERAIRELVFDFQSDGYSGRDVTLAAKHLLDGKKVIEMAYAENPMSIIWAVRDDGVLLGLTHDRQLEALAWHRHTTDGVIESVCSIPEGTEDGVYVVVKRTINGSTKRYIERLATRVVTDVRLGVFLDSALSFDGRDADSKGGASVTVTVNNQTGWAPGDQVDVTRSSGTFVSTDVGDDIVLDPDGDGDGPVRLRVDSLISGTKVRAVISEVPGAEVPASFRNVATTDWGWARDTFSGLTHLEGETVTILSDGHSIGTAVVASGAITLPNEERGVIVHIGLAYESDLELLDLVAEKAELKGLEKTVRKVLIDVEASRGLWAGEKFDRIKEWQQREVADSYGAIPLHTGMVEIYTDTDWNRGGRAVLRQKEPLPLTVLGVTRDAEIGG